MNFNKISVENCLYSLPEKPKRILVVGAGAWGEDVKFLNELTGGSAEIHGLDIETEVGKNYKAANVCYLNCSVYEMPYRSEYFDLAYSFATFEHIKDLQKGWQQMLNVTRKGGTVYSLSSPLWHSPFGHHKSFFENYPWIHLLHPSPDELLNFCVENNIKSPDETPLIHHINYMLHDDYFNKLKPSAYEKAALSLEGCTINQSFNKVDLNSYKNYDHVLNAGYSLDDISCVTHYLKAVKN